MARSTRCDEAASTRRIDRYRPIRVRWVGLLVLLGATICGQPAAAERSGVTWSVGMGGGWTFLPGDYPLDSPQQGWGGPSIALGGFLDERTAVFLRLTGTSFEAPTYVVTLRDSTGKALTEFAPGDVFAQSFAGFVVQRWLMPRIAVGGGVGAALYGPSDVAEAGLALSASVTAAAVVRAGWGMHATIEFLPAMYDLGTVLGTALLLEIQWY